MEQINEEKNKFIQTQVDKIEDFKMAQKVFRQLADANRLRILWLLCHKEACVLDISEILNMSSPAVSHHLKMLKAENLIISRRLGKAVYHKVATTKQADLFHYALDEILKINCVDDEKLRLIKCYEAQKKRMENIDSQAILAKQIHDFLMENLDKHITIEELSKKYLTNPTTLKKIFKNIYKTSLANHIKIHRLEKAAYLLKNNKDTILNIAKSVGYSSQSKFTRAFKEIYGVVPTKYRNG